MQKYNHNKATTISFNARFVEIKLEQPTLSDEDISFIYNHYGSFHMARYLDSYVVPKSYTEAQNMVSDWIQNFENGMGITWYIKDARVNKTIGTIGYWTIDRVNKSAEMFFDIIPEYEGRGIVSECAAKVTDFGILNLGLMRIQGCVDTSNRASLRVFRSLGFNEEGVLKSFRIINKNSKDVFIFSYTPRQNIITKVIELEKAHQQVIYKRPTDSFEIETDVYSAIRRRESLMDSFKEKNVLSKNIENVSHDKYKPLLQEKLIYSNTNKDLI